MKQSSLLVDVGRLQVVSLLRFQFNSSPLKNYRAPKGKDHLPTIIFQGQTVKVQVVDFKESTWVSQN